MIKINEIHNMDAFDLLREIDDESVDAVICDPPYGLGIDVWDVKIDAKRFLNECYRICKPDSFIAFFQQMPYALDWLNAADAVGLKYKEHISWIKRRVGTNYSGLQRGHESIYIYRKGSPKFYTTKGVYQDVKVPGLMFDVVTIDSIQRHFSELYAQIKRGGQPREVKDTGKSHESYKHISRQRNGVRYMSPETVNFTNVWSFLPENARHTHNFNHATVKPLVMVERLVQLLTDPGMMVVDPFVGSGTTAAACKRTGRNFIAGDFTVEFCEIANARLDELDNGQLELIFDSAYNERSTVVKE